MRQVWTFIPAHYDPITWEQVEDVWRLVTFGEAPCPYCGNVAKAMSMIEPAAYAHEEARALVERVARETVENIGRCPCGGAP